MSSQTLVKYSSGVTPSSGVTSITPVAVGFGVYSSLTPPDFPDASASLSDIQATQFAFTAGSDGSIKNLYVSTDIHVLPIIVNQNTLIYTYTLYKSPASTPAFYSIINPYVSTGLSVLTTFPAILGIVIPHGWLTAVGQNTTEVSVSKGDRIVLVVSSNSPDAPTFTDLLGFSATLEFVSSS